MSTAKSLANSYLTNKRMLANKSGTLISSTTNKFKSSSSNLAGSRSVTPSTSYSKNRLRAASMSNLVSSEPAGGGGSSSTENQQQNQTKLGHQTPEPGKIHRPASRSAIDSIHQGMNAKYSQVQSKVLTQNIRPHSQSTGRLHHAPSPSSKRPPFGGGRGAASGVKGSPGSETAASKADRAALGAKLKALQEELDRCELEREQLKQELEREKADKADQAQQTKQELQEKMAEHEKQSEEYHNKLLEAYELADQNRRAADTLLSESRQRDDENRKKLEELESQLAELKEFVAIKDELTGKMGELRDQLKSERERYEEQLRSLHQVFENEKLRYDLNNNKQPKSNYFQRIKPSLDSCESLDQLNINANPTINQLENGRPLNGNHLVATPIDREPHLLSASTSALGCSNRAAKSDQDIYGSRLSTRMQDTAKSAWRASKQFASSVITGGIGGISGCRKLRGKRSRVSGQPVDTNLNNSSECGRTTVEIESCREPTGSGINNQLEREREDDLTSVIKVGLSSGPNSRQAAGSPIQTELEHQQQRIGDASEPEVPNSGASSLIRVDENNKLTIVTKFNGQQAAECSPSGSACSSGCPMSSQVGQQPQLSIEVSSASSSSSERLRCESSSSGRGTSSETGSAGSQNGDEENQLASPSVGNSERRKSTQSATNKKPFSKRSLLKASKMLSGSQVSLNKIKSLFASSNNNNKDSSVTFVAAINHSYYNNNNNNVYTRDEHVGADGKQASGSGSPETGAIASHLCEAEQLRNSRLRCMALNQAIRSAPVAQSVVANRQLLGGNSELGQGDQKDEEKTSSNSNSNSNIQQQLHHQTSKPEPAKGADGEGDESKDKGALDVRSDATAGVEETPASSFVTVG